jgi:hypothetical protein
VTRDFCDLPSEGEVQSYLSDMSEFDLTRFVRISRLELVQTTITAISGDFGAITRVAMYYAPANEPDGEVLLGSASSPAGFGDTIVLFPEDTVDFLELIRENDADTSGECPQVRIEVVVNDIPATDISYELDIILDAYARLGF